MFLSLDFYFFIMTCVLYGVGTQNFYLLISSILDILPSHKLGGPHSGLNLYSLTFMNLLEGRSLQTHHRNSPLNILRDFRLLVFLICKRIRWYRDGNRYASLLSNLKRSWYFHRPVSSWAACCRLFQKTGVRWFQPLILSY